MIELSATAYLWIKALHIIAVIAWMAGMLYLPRLFVYHCEAEPGSGLSETFKVMERRLLRAIVNPAMVAALVFGGILLANLGAEQWRDGWLHAKLALVVALFVMHHLMARWRKAFERDENTRPAKFYRRMNEVPAVLMAAIVILAVVRPF
ncbi:MAG: protoporphyrinogen oxidase HemJ [Rhodospirillales bacterium]|nr:protoporphyrinogen oxidase HemJ [Rhodospirillales bacterium]